MHFSRKVGMGVLFLALTAASVTRADSVLILGDGDAANTEAAKAVLLADGHTSVTIDSRILSSFDGTGLAGYSAVVLLDDNLGSGYIIPTAGQNALVNFVNSGGGLITSEWINYDAAVGLNTALEPVIPVKPSTFFSFGSPITYSQNTPDATIDSGLPNSFTFNASNDSGTEDLYQQKPGAIEFFASSGLASAGLIGWDYNNGGAITGGGRVISFSTIIAAENYPSGTDPEMNDPNYSRLFSNSVFWAENLSPAPVPLPASFYSGAALIGTLLLARQLRTRNVLR